MPEVWACQGISVANRPKHKFLWTASRLFLLCYHRPSFIFYIIYCERWAVTKKKSASCHKFLNFLLFSSSYINKDEN